MTSSAVSWRLRLLRLGATFVAASLVGLAFGVVQLSLQAARTVVLPPRHLTGVTPADFGLPFEPVEFPTADGLTLRAWLVPGGSAAVVLAHGHQGSKQDMLDHAHYLYAAGYSVLLVDFRASGESEGTYSTLGYQEWQDLVGAASYLRTRPGIDPERIGLLGVSMGASAALQLGEQGRQFKAIVADSAFATAETMVGRFDRWFKLPAWPFSTLVPWAIHHYVGVVPSAVAPLKAVARIAPTAVFIIHGALDIGIPVEDAQSLFDAAQDPKTLWIVEGASHGGGHGVVKEEYERRVLAFFERHLAVP